MGLDHELNKDSASSKAITMEGKIMLKTVPVPTTLNCLINLLALLCRRRAQPRTHSILSSTLMVQKFHAICHGPWTLCLSVLVLWPRPWRRVGFFRWQPTHRWSALKPVKMINASVTTKSSQHIDNQQFAIQDWKDACGIIMPTFLASPFLQTIISNLSVGSFIPVTPAAL